MNLLLFSLILVSDEYSSFHLDPQSSKAVALEGSGSGAPNPFCIMTLGLRGTCPRCRGSVASGERPVLEAGLVCWASQLQPTGPVVSRR